MAATYGRLTGRAGVCLTTLGPGALNLTTSAAYAHLGAMPMVMITGQKADHSSRQAKFQIVDIVATMRPLTKMATQIVSAQSIPTLVRDAFRVAQQERPGPVHLELPEDVASDEAAAEIIHPHPSSCRSRRTTRSTAPPHDRIGAQAAAGDAGRRRQPSATGRAAVATSSAGWGFRSSTPRWARARSPGSNLYMGTAALSERDWIHEASTKADLIISIGHDTSRSRPSS
jgi:acetolactate synthase-1/2/3 large subunit